MFYIRCYPNETTMVMYCDADAMNVFSRPTMTNAILYTESYITFPQPILYCLIAFYQFIINEYVMLCYLLQLTKGQGRD